MNYGAGAGAAAGPLAPHPEEPKATTKHTLCGYGWSDVTNSLLKAIGAADMVRALRWSAELVCSEQGLGRLEATLLHGWALHVGHALPTWPRTWFTTITQIRQLWEKANGDTRAIRNTPVVRQMVAEAVATLVLAAKKPLPTLPTAADCFKEAETIRSRMRSGGGVGDQIATRRVWSAGADGADLRTIGNEFEAALRSADSRMYFWIVWLMTLDKQEDAPMARDRGPASLSVKQRKSLVWFLVALLREIANEGAFLSVEDRNGMFGVLETCWVKLGEKGRRDMLAAFATCIQDHLQRRGSVSLTGSLAAPAASAVRAATLSLDAIYSGIAEEARRYRLEVPRIVGLTPAAAGGAAAAARAAPPKLDSMDKLALAYSLIGK
jgi:hypothetical protein